MPKRYRLTAPAKDSVAGDLTAVDDTDNLSQWMDGRENLSLVWVLIDGISVALPAVLLEEVTPTTPEEPPPGIYQIGDLLAIRNANDTDLDRWMVLPLSSSARTSVVNSSWATWEEAWIQAKNEVEIEADPDIVPLRPAPYAAVGEKVQRTLPDVISYPGPGIAVMTAAGGWYVIDTKNAPVLQRGFHELEVCRATFVRPALAIVASARVIKCNRHVDGWHVGGHGALIYAVWPIAPWELSSGNGS